jgi:hypothetical protein
MRLWYAGMPDAAKINDGLVVASVGMYFFMAAEITIIITIIKYMQ